MLLFIPLTETAELYCGGNIDVALHQFPCLLYLSGIIADCEKDTGQSDYENNVP